MRPGTRAQALCQPSPGGEIQAPPGWPAADGAGLRHRFRDNRPPPLPFLPAPSRRTNREEARDFLGVGGWPPKGLPLRGAPVVTSC